MKPYSLASAMDCTLKVKRENSIGWAVTSPYFLQQRRNDLRNIKFRVHTGFFGQEKKSSGSPKENLMYKVIMKWRTCFWKKSSMCVASLVPSILSVGLRWGGAYYGAYRGRVVPAPVSLGWARCVCPAEHPCGATLGLLVSLQ